MRVPNRLLWIAIVSPACLIAACNNSGESVSNEMDSASLSTDNSVVSMGSSNEFEVDSSSGFVDSARSKERADRDFDYFPMIESSEPPPPPPPPPPKLGQHKSYYDEEPVGGAPKSSGSAMSQALLLSKMDRLIESIDTTNSTMDTVLAKEVLSRIRWNAYLNEAATNSVSQVIAFLAGQLQIISNGSNFLQDHSSRTFYTNALESQDGLVKKRCIKVVRDRWTEIITADGAISQLPSEGEVSEFLQGYRNIHAGIDRANALCFVSINFDNLMADDLQKNAYLQTQISQTLVNEARSVADLSTKLYRKLIIKYRELITN